LQSEFPGKQLVGSCTMCKYMKSNTLEDILRALKKPLARDRVVLDESTRLRALKSIEAMFRWAEAK
jgi:quinolinate synthase